MIASIEQSYGSGTSHTLFCLHNNLKKSYIILVKILDKFRNKTFCSWSSLLLLVQFSWNGQSVNQYLLRSFYLQSILKIQRDFFQETWALASTLQPRFLNCVVRPPWWSGAKILCSPMQGTCVRSLVREHDPTCHNMLQLKILYYAIKIKDPACCN